MRRTGFVQSLYAVCARAVLVRPALAGWWAVGCACVAVGQGAMAGAGGLLAREVARAVSPSMPSHAMTFALVGAGAAALKGVGSALLASTEARLGGHAGVLLRDRVATGLLARGGHRGGAADVARIVGALRAVERAVVAGVLGSLRGVAQLLPMVVGLAVLAPRLGLTALAVLIPFAIALSRLRQLVRGEERVALSRAAELEGEVDELVRHVDLWRTFGSGERARATVASRGHAAADATARAHLHRALSSSGNELLAALSLVGIVIALRRGLVTLDGPTLVLFLAVFFLSYRPLRDLGDARSALRAGDAALDALGPWLDDTSGPSVACGSPAPPRAPLPLVASSFGAEGHAATWTFTVAPGELAVVIGPTGSGKTTLLRALLGLVPNVGALHYGERSLENAGVGPEQRPFAWAPQDSPVVGGSLRDNLELGGAPADDARLRELSGGRFVEEVETALLGASGRPLSGGERAWVSLARALASTQPVLLLDEPTAHLDADAEHRVLALLSRLRGERTILLVTHRPAPLAVADVVIELGAPPRRRAA